jgi:hypothetical protein
LRSYEALLKKKYVKDLQLYAGGIETDGRPRVKELRTHIHISTTETSRQVDGALLTTQIVNHRQGASSLVEN